MSENNKTGLIITDPEVLAPEPFDFDFITSTLNLIPIQGDNAAINLTSITDMERDENNDWVVTLSNDQRYTLSDADMAELGKNLRRRIEDNKARAKENMREQGRMQAEIMAEIQNGVQPGLAGIPVMGKRFRQ